MLLPLHLSQQTMRGYLVTGAPDRTVRSTGVTPAAWAGAIRTVPLYVIPEGAGPVKSLNKGSCAARILLICLSLLGGRRGSAP
jgi:hypothetical protein